MGALTRRPTTVRTREVDDGRTPGTLIRRVTAYALDATVLLVALVAGQGALVLIGAHPFVASDGTVAAPGPGALHAWVAGTATVPFLLYFAAAARSARGATVGKRILGLSVVGPDGARLGAGRALARSAALLLPFEANHVVLFHVVAADASATWANLGFTGVSALIATYLLSMPLSRHGRSAHDHWTGTRVVRSGPARRTVEATVS